MLVPPFRMSLLSPFPRVGKQPGSGVWQLLCPLPVRPSDLCTLCLGIALPDTLGILEAGYQAAGEASPQSCSTEPAWRQGRQQRLCCCGQCRGGGAMRAAAAVSLASLRLLPALLVQHSGGLCCHGAVLAQHPSACALLPNACVPASLSQAGLD